MRRILLSYDCEAGFEWTNVQNYLKSSKYHFAESLMSMNHLELRIKYRWSYKEFNICFNRWYTKDTQHKDRHTPIRLLSEVWDSSYLFLAQFAFVTNFKCLRISISNFAHLATCHVIKQSSEATQSIQWW